MNSMVISGINLFEGGPLSVYYDCLNSIIDLKIYEKYNITIFVHKYEMFLEYEDYFEIIELPKSRRSYINRLYYEFFYFYKFSKGRNIDIWISLHDITPRVKSKNKYTYCHNPSPFLKTDITKIRYNAKYVAFSLFYKYLYRLNIHSNTALIVQQDWIRKEFAKMYSIPTEKIIVAKPEKTIDDIVTEKPNIKYTKDKLVFFFPSYPRYFKNFDVICKAAKDLERDDYEIWITISGKENQYAKELYNNYKSVKNIKWLGILPRKEIFDIYSEVDCLIFPSLLETWGLPISEFKLTGKPMILSDLPYSYETVGKYDKCVFFKPTDYKMLKKYILDFISDKIQFQPQPEKIIASPLANSWNELFANIIL